MKKIAYRLLFWILWPLVWVYAPLRTRARVLVVSGDTFLAVIPYFGGQKWQLPGGGIKFGETPKIAAMREVQEELGITLNPKKTHQLLPIAPYTHAGLLVRYALFVSKVDTPEVSKNNHELLASTWLPLQQSKAHSDYVNRAIRAYNQAHLLK
jgi:8-oxo-dGTP pyrophosphatase MutT (NUDIX family)